MRDLLSTTREDAGLPVEVAGLSKTYGTHAAVRGVSFGVRPGTITGFLGPNGAGRSITLRMLVGLTPGWHRPCSVIRGVLILDEPANGLDPAGIHWMRGLLRDFADGGGSVLLSSHLLREIELIADDRMVIGRGRIVAQRSKHDLPASTGTFWAWW